jgi:hypothetical protein
MRWATVAGIVLFCSSFLSAQNRALNGAFQGDLYECDSLGFSYHLPDGYKPNFGVTNNLPTGAQYLFVADAHTGGPIFNRIVLTADDAQNNYLSLQDYARKMTKALAVQPQTVLVHDATAVQICRQGILPGGYERALGGRCFVQDCALG